MPQEYTKVDFVEVQSKRDPTSIVYEARREGRKVVVLSENAAMNILLLPPEDQSAAVDEELAKGAAAWERDTEANREQFEQETERNQRETTGEAHQE